MTAIAIFSVLAILFLATFAPTSGGYVLSLNEKNDTRFGWHFPKDRPYHYFNLTTEIPASFLPVKVSALPNGRGLWILRHKDFVGEPKTFSTGKKDTSESVITFSSTAQMFYSVTIKVLAFGDAELKVNFGNGEPSTGPRHSKPEAGRKNEKISLLDNESCTESSEGEDGLRWIIYQVETTQTSHMSLEASIPHNNAFIILDEILVYFDHSSEIPASDDDDGDNSGKKKANKQDTSGGDLHEGSKLRCRVAN